MTDERPTPALYDWAKKVYDKMADGASPEVVEEGEEPAMVYEGFLTNLFRGLEVPNPYYTSIMKALKNQGCVLQLRRGGGSATSKWILIHEPDEETFKDAAERNTRARGKMGILEQRVNDLQRLVRTLMGRVEVLEEMQKQGVK